MMYIASPYTHDNPTVMKQRFEQVAGFTAYLMRDGFDAYSPIVHGHAIAELHDLPVDWAFWRKHCLSMLRKADAMTVYCLDGWQDSVGVQAEIEFCASCGIPIQYQYHVWRGLGS